MDELLSKTGRTLRTLKYGDLVEGQVVSISRNQVLIDIKAKSEGMVSLKELTEDPSIIKRLSLGDKVTASVLSPENERGYVVLSLRRAASQSRWRDLEALFKDGQNLEVRITEYNKGGFLVDAGIPGFIPLTHIARSRMTGIKGPEELVGQTILVKIIEMDRTLNRLVLSEKEAQSQMSVQKREEILAGLKVGQEVSGEVSAILPFGIFVEVNGVEGLCHISEISWEKIEDPGSLFKVGDKVNLKVLEVDPPQNKLSLSIKSLLENPWRKVMEKYKVGERLTGTVSKIVPFGAFVSLEPGLEGLIHVSETVGPLKVGEKVEAEIISIEPERQKLGLSVRKLREVMMTYK